MVIYPGNRNLRESGYIIKQCVHFDYFIKYPLSALSMLVKVIKRNSTPCARVPLPHKISTETRSKKPSLYNSATDTTRIRDIHLCPLFFTEIQTIYQITFSPFTNHVKVNTVITLIPKANPRALRSNELNAPLHETQGMAPESS
jgi:hypothetical protein